MKKLICTIMNLKNITSRLIVTVFLLVGCVLTLNATRNGLTASTPVGFCAKRHDGWSLCDDNDDDTNLWGHGSSAWDRGFTTGN